MIKTILVIVLAVAVCAQPIVDVEEMADAKRPPMLIGGFHDIEPQDQLSQEELELQASLDSLARTAFSEKNNGEELGPLKKMSTQVVAGMNYKLSYLRSNGEIVQITIYMDLNQILSVREIISSVNAN